MATRLLCFGFLGRDQKKNKKKPKAEVSGFHQCVLNVQLSNLIFKDIQFLMKRIFDKWDHNKDSSAQNEVKYEKCLKTQVKYHSTFYFLVCYRGQSAGKCQITHRWRSSGLSWKHQSMLSATKSFKEKKNHREAHRDQAECVELVKIFTRSAAHCEMVWKLSRWLGRCSHQHMHERPTPTKW